MIAVHLKNFFKPAVSELYLFPFLPLPKSIAKGDSVTQLHTRHTHQWALCSSVPTTAALKPSGQACLILTELQQAAKVY